MKHPITWYQKNYENATAHFKKEKEKLYNQIASIERQEKEYAFLKEQIDKAIELGKTEFDSDRFMKRKC